MLTIAIVIGLAFLAIHYAEHTNNLPSARVKYKSQSFSFKENERCVDEKTTVA